MNKKHTKEEWLEALELYKKGYGSTLIARRTGLDDSDIRRRIRQYLVSGIWQTEIKHPVRVSPSIKKKRPLTTWSRNRYLVPKSW